MFRFEIFSNKNRIINEISINDRQIFNILVLNALLNTYDAKYRSMFIRIYSNEAISQCSV